MKMTLYKMGNDFCPQDNRMVSDVGNYRVRAIFTDIEGVRVTADFGSCTVIENAERWYFGRPVCSGSRSDVHPNALYIDASYKDKTDTWRDYVYTYMDNSYDYSLKYDYTIAGIKAFLFDITGQTVDKLEFAEYTGEDSK